MENRYYVNTNAENVCNVVAIVFLIVSIICAVVCLLVYYYRFLDRYRSLVS